MRQGGKMVLCALCALVLGIGSARFAAVCGQGLGAELRRAEYQKLQSFAFSNIDRFQVPSLVTRLTSDVTTIQNAVSSGLRPACRSPIMLLANVFSGITLLASRPIAVGNFVEIGGQSGTVRSIGLFYTCLATPDNKIIYVPNGDITGSKIINYSTEPVRRVDLNVGTSYDCPTETVRSAILEAVANTDKVLNDPAPFVALAAYNASNIEYTVRVWCNTEDYWDVHFALNENIRASFDRHAVEMSYEHLNVHIMKD